MKTHSKTVTSLASPRLASLYKWRILILFIFSTSFSMFGQKNIDGQGKAAKDIHAQHEPTVTHETYSNGITHLPNNTKEQIAFNVRLQAFVDSCINDPLHLTRFADQKHTCSTHEPVDIASLAKEEARNEFIIQNLEAYKHLFITAAKSMTILEVCDNGGFEQDFLYYEGFTSTFTHGSDTCSPHNSSGPSTFIPATLPTTNRFEIVTSGTDPLVGINRTKFGNKALRINNRYGHTSNLCAGSRGVDKITKKFEVTSTNRIFNIWYAVVLENPPGHNDSQPFLSMKCDLDPGSELCFAADFLDCDSTYIDSCEYSPIDVLDWTCHQFRIDSIYIGDTATLEITVADCGLGCHFGYAYIDGICEECTGSALGEIFLETIYYNVDCEGDTASICGSYNPPEICNQNWWLDSIMVNGYSVPGFNIDTVSNTFCVFFPKSNFGTDSCLTVFVKGKFTNGSEFTPFQESNEIEVCQNLYSIPSIDIVVSGCMSNTPTGGSANFNISDDYYYVTIELENHDGLDWSILRTLVDPYPDEEDTRELANGTGNTALVLGPFKIQEGGWLLTLYVEGGCEIIEYVDPPAYCSGCSAFYDVEIGNVQCLDDDEWSFDIEVPSETSGSYDLNGISYNYNEIYTIDELVIGEGCLNFILEGNPNCISEFIICPPKPCSFNCNLEVYVEDVPCTKDENGDITYYVDLEVQWPPSKYACYEATDVDGNSLDDGPLPSPQQVGPFDEDIYLTIKICNSSCSPTASCPCYKTIYVPTPDCNQNERISFTGTSEAEPHTNPIVYVQPNPTHSDEIIIYSSLPKTEYVILDVQGKRIVTNSFIGQRQSQTLHVPPGMYFLKYKDLVGQISVIKIIKL